jgi:hypothetical protein|tara:strand:+ start:40 stop:315 length:276 start_codon:yes stop_codon:yes gene_type:complete
MGNLNKATCSGGVDRHTKNNAKLSSASKEYDVGLPPRFGLGPSDYKSDNNFGSDCEKGWAKAHEDAIAEYKENNGSILNVGTDVGRIIDLF